MKATDVVKEIKNIGICRPWYLKMKKEPTLKNLCEMYFKGSDWALENNFPTRAFLSKYKGLYEEYGMYYNENLSCTKSDMALFDCNADLKLENREISQIIIRGNSKVTLLASGNSIAFVTILDESILNVQIEDDADVRVYRYGGEVNGVEVNERKWEK